MPRQPRFQLPGMPQHVIQRGNNRAACFFDQADYIFYLQSLHEACKRYGCQLHAYVLMTNHVHLLMTPDVEGAISSVMQSTGGRYVKYINRLYGRTGGLWEGRYKASLIQTERYLLTCYRYIEMNPVRAMLVTHPAEYSWSSYRANAQNEENAFLTPHNEYQRLGRNQEDRAKSYRDLFRYQLSENDIDEIRTALNHELVVGSGRFRDEIAHACQRRVEIGRPGRPRKER